MSLTGNGLEVTQLLFKRMDERLAVRESLQWDT